MIRARVEPNRLRVEPSPSGFRGRPHDLLEPSAVASKGSVFGRLLSMCISVVIEMILGALWLLFGGLGGGTPA